MTGKEANCASSLKSLLGTSKLEAYSIQCFRQVTTLQLNYKQLFQQFCILSIMSGKDP